MNTNLNKDFENNYKPFNITDTDGICIKYYLNLYYKCLKSKEENKNNENISCDNLFIDCISNCYSYQKDFLQYLKHK